MSKSKYFNKKLQKRYALLAGAASICYSLANHVNREVEFCEDNPVVSYFVASQVFLVCAIGLLASYFSKKQVPTKARSSSGLEDKIES